ncbi:hypothetical protein [Blautia obeum]|jgi:hypothetical protein|uniref:Uncharacterized protein n=1 Tax=Blautia obeum TaxID=40520 RepID=A0A415HVN3_9FIRM|nr:hypothetical protein [Blautia obeum]RHK98329.1 hypothetical protein DW040_03195 [Blautia obeum]
MKRGWDFGDFEITKREILVSVSIIAIMLLIGTLLSAKISNWQMDRNEKYNKAVKIENNTDLFQYGMDTNVGNAFVYGELKAIDTVTYPEIGGKYIYVEKVKEKYTKHTRRVAHRSGNRTYYTTETYWTWDYAGSDDKECKEISFCGVDFPIKKIDYPSPDYIQTIKESYYIRYKYYGTATKYKGTIFTVLKNKTIVDGSSFYEDSKIPEVIDRLESGIWNVVFWIFWILLTGFAVFGFYYLDNEWLE